MGEEAFYSFLREVYQTYAMEIVRSEDILKILRKYDNSSKMNELLAFYFDESQEWSVRSFSVGMYMFVTHMFFRDVCHTR